MTNSIHPTSSHNDHILTEAYNVNQRKPDYSTDVQQLFVLFRSIRLHEGESNNLPYVCIDGSSRHSFAHALSDDFCKRHGPLDKGFHLRFCISMDVYIHSKLC